MTREIRSSWKMVVAGGNDATEILDARLYLSRDWTCAMPRCQYAVPSSYLSCKLPNPGNLKCQRPAINTTVPRRKCETCCQSLYQASDSVRNFSTHTRILSYLHDIVTRPLRLNYVEICLKIGNAIKKIF